MQAKMAMVTVLADDVAALARFYSDTLGLQVKSARDDCVEMETDGIRFAICSRSVMKGLTQHSSYGDSKVGQALALSFALRTHDQVDEIYADLVARGVSPVQPPATVAGGQRVAFFSDPEGNIHQLFAELPAVADYCW